MGNRISFTKRRTNPVVGRPELRVSTISDHQITPKEESLTADQLKDSLSESCHVQGNNVRLYLELSGAHQISDSIALCAGARATFAFISNGSHNRSQVEKAVENGASEDVSANSGTISHASENLKRGKIYNWKGTDRRTSELGHEESTDILKKVNEELKDKYEKMKTDFQKLIERNGMVEEERQKLKDDLRLVSQIKTLQSSTAGGSCQKTEVALLLIYNDLFPATDLREIQKQGSYPKCGRSFTMCRIPHLTEGWKSFEEVRDSLRPLFGKEIGVILQAQGRWEDEDLAEITSQDDEWEIDWSKKPFCTADGKTRMTGVQAEKMEEIGEGGRVLLIGGGHRTVLKIFASPRQRQRGGEDEN